MAQEIEKQKMSNVWKELKNLGYDNGDCILYSEFITACEPVCDPTEIDIDTFEEKYDVVIG